MRFLRLLVNISLLMRNCGLSSLKVLYIELGISFYATKVTFYIIVLFLKIGFIQLYFNRVAILALKEFKAKL